MLSKLQIDFLLHVARIRRDQLEARAVASELASEAFLAVTRMVAECEQAAQDPVDWAKAYAEVRDAAVELLRLQGVRPTPEAGAARDRLDQVIKQYEGGTPRPLAVRIGPEPGPGWVPT